MATISDMYKLRECMDKAMQNPMQLVWFERLPISFVPSMMCWEMTFESDLTVFFNDVSCAGNSMQLELNGVVVAYFTHMHQRPPGYDSE